MAYKKAFLEPPELAFRAPICTGCDTAAEPGDYDTWECASCGTSWNEDGTPDYRGSVHWEQGDNVPDLYYDAKTKLTPETPIEAIPTKHKDKVMFYTIMINGKPDITTSTSKYAKEYINDLREKIRRHYDLQK